MRTLYGATMKEPRWGGDSDSRKPSTFQKTHQCREQGYPVEKNAKPARSEGGVFVPDGALKGVNKNMPVGAVESVRDLRAIKKTCRGDLQTYTHGVNKGKKQRRGDSTICRGEPTKKSRNPRRLFSGGSAKRDELVKRRTRRLGRRKEGGLRRWSAVM